MKTKLVFTEKNVYNDGKDAVVEILTSTPIDDVLFHKIVEELNSLKLRTPSEERDTEIFVKKICEKFELCLVPMNFETKFIEF